MHPLAVASQVLSAGASQSPSFMPAEQGAHPYCLATQGPSSPGCVAVWGSCQLGTLVRLGSWGRMGRSSVPAADPTPLLC